MYVRSRSATDGQILVLSYIFTPLERAWHFRELIRAVVRRELAVRFRGSILGWLWAVFGPLVMLVAYTIIFSNGVGMRRSGGGGVQNYALSIFAGLIVFNLFAELMNRAPGLLHEHANFIKKSIFPSETLAWTASIRAFTYAGISFAVLLIFIILVTRSLPPTLLFLPFIIVPFWMFLLGASWFLMALGSFTRDVSHLIVTIIPIFMFATPIFYTMEDVPPKARLLFHLNLIGDYVEMFRGAAVGGSLPDPTLYFASVAVSLLVFAFSYRFFMRYKAIFVDVI